MAHSSSICGVAKESASCYGAYDRRGRLSGCRSIGERPRIVEQKRRIGDWEADTIIGQHHKQAILSLTERRRSAPLKPAERNTAEAIEMAVAELLQSLKQKCHMITSDNGREFAHHQASSAKLQAAFYFAHPTLLGSAV